MWGFRVDNSADSSSLGRFGVEVTSGGRIHGRNSSFEVETELGLALELEGMRGVGKVGRCW